MNYVPTNIETVKTELEVESLNEAITRKKSESEIRKPSSKKKPRD